MIRNLMKVWFLSLVLLGTTLTAGEWTGYLKNFSWVADPAIGTFPVDRVASSATRLRLQYQDRLTDRWSFEGAGEFSLLVQHHTLFAGGIFSETGSATYRFSDPDHLIFPDHPDRQDNLGGTANLDRFRFTWHGDRLDVILGRQPVSWGSGKIVNPTDILAPYAFTELDTEYRIGVDAVRFRYAMGAMSELDAGMVLGPDGDLDESAVYLRGKTYVGSTDISALVMRFRRHRMVGLDITRAFGGTGAWLEAALVSPACYSDGLPQDNYIRLTAGLDRQLTPRLYAYLEYHLNTAGSSDADGYAFLADDPAYRDGSVYLLGRHYLGTGFSFQLTGLTTVNGLVLTNLSDGSAFGSLNMEYNVARNLYLSAGMYLNRGSSPVLSAAPPFVQVMDEFGSYPDLLYVSLRWYF